MVIDNYLQMFSPDELEDYDVVLTMLYVASIDLMSQRDASSGKDL